MAHSFTSTGPAPSACSKAFCKVMQTGPTLAQAALVCMDGGVQKGMRTCGGCCSTMRSGPEIALMKRRSGAQERMRLHAEGAARQQAALAARADAELARLRAAAAAAASDAAQVRPASSAEWKAGARGVALRMPCMPALPRPPGRPLTGCPGAAHLRMPGRLARAQACAHPLCAFNA